MKTADFPQLALMRAGIEFRFEISVRQFKVKVRPLTNLEIIQATGDAAAAYEKTPEHQRSSITLSLLHAMYQLERASAPDIGEPGEISLALLQHMNNEEVNTLWKQYVRVCDKVNPSFEKIGLEEVDRMVEDLKKNLDPLSQLTDLSISNLIAVCLRLVEGTSRG